MTKLDKKSLAAAVEYIESWLDSILGGRSSDVERDLNRRQAQADNVKVCLELLNLYRV